VLLLARRGVLLGAAMWCSVVRCTVVCCCLFSFLFLARALSVTFSLPPTLSVSLYLSLSFLHTLRLTSFISLSLSLSLSHTLSLACALSLPRTNTHTHTNTGHRTSNRLPPRKTRGRIGRGRIVDGWGASTIYINKHIIRQDTHCHNPVHLRSRSTSHCRAQCHGRWERAAS